MDNFEHEESVDEYEQKFNFKPSYVLVAVDTHHSMFETDGAPSPYRNCMNALYRLSDALLLKSDRRGWSPFSIVLYEQEGQNNLVNFSDNMIETTKLLKHKTTLSELELKSKYMRNSQVDLAAFLQFCKKKFKEVSSTFYKRIMIFITNDPDPVNGDANKRFTALNEVKNFEENDIVFELIVTKEDFDLSTFYNELFSLLNQQTLQICEDEEGLYEKLISTIWFRHFQRKLQFYPFLDDLSKYITVYKKSYLKNRPILNNAHVARDGMQVKKVRENLESSSLPQNHKDEFRLVDGDEKDAAIENISFDLADKLEAESNSFPIGYTLLYVCHRLSKVGEVITEPRILEADYKDELPYFRHFWQHCVNNEKVLICVKVMKKSEQPRLVELIPKFIHGQKVFLIKQIPFADEYFGPKGETEGKNERKTFSSEQEQIIDKLIDQLKLEFSSSLLIDGETLRKEAYLKSKLLEEPRGEEVNYRDPLSTEDIDNKAENIGNYSYVFPPEKGTKRRIK